MTHERSETPYVGKNARLPNLATIAVLFGGCSALLSVGANAAALPRHTIVTMAEGANRLPWGDNDGNGKHNRTSISVNSPTINRGIQHITNITVSGSTNTQASFCRRKFHHCRINQKLVVFDP
jgi:hypothetical protein